MGGAVHRTPWIVGGLLLAVVAVPSLAAGHPYHLEVANEVLNAPDAVDVSNWIGQSFATSSTFFVSRIALYASDVGASDVLTVQLRSDTAGLPSTTVLTQGTADGPSAPGWLDLDLAPYVLLNDATTYWIVAHSTAAGGDGYEWWDSGNELAYLGGIGVDSSDGVVWNPRGRDFAFRVYGFVQPSLTFSAASSATSLRPGETVTFWVNFSNTGPDSAAALWVNVSLPPELTYTNDNASSIGGVRSGAYTFTFTDVAPGSYGFFIEAVVNGGVANGTAAVTQLTIEATDHIGTRLPTWTRDFTVTVRNAHLELSLQADASAVDPGDVLTLNATVTNDGAEVASNVDLEASVDPDATYQTSSSNGSYDPLARVVHWSFASLNAGQAQSIGWTVGVTPGVPDLTAVTSSMQVAYEDVSATAMPNETAMVTARAQVPVFVPVLRTDRAAAARGEEITATLYYNNSGSGTALSVSANWSLGGHFELVGLVPAVPYAPLNDGFVVDVSSVGPGPHTMAARLRVVRGLQDGLSLDFQVDWTATDGNGNPLAGAAPAASVELLAPAVGLELGPNDVRVEAGATFDLVLTLRNEGRAPGTGWLNLTLPEGVAYVGDNGTFAVDASAGRVTWTLSSLPAGSTAALRITFRANERPTLVALRFALDYTDGQGSVPLSVTSNSVSTEIVPARPALWPWFALVAVPVGAAAVLVLYRRRGRPEVEEVFVADRSGLLVAHRSASIVSDQDEDVLVAMFKAVQDFVRDSFARGTDEEIRSLEFGERKILIERGPHHFIAVVYRGRDGGGLTKRLRTLSAEVERRFGEVLADWDGDTESVRGIAALLPRLWSGESSGRGERPSMVKREPKLLDEKPPLP